MLSGSLFGWSCSWVDGLLLVALLLQIYCALNVSASDPIKECFNGNEQDRLGNVTIECREGYVINMEDALLGRNKWGDCVIVDGDCVEKTRIFSSCDGQRVCSKTYKTYSAQCGYSTIMVLSYTCQPSLATLIAVSSTSTATPAIVNSSLDVLNIVQNRSKRPSVYTVAPDVRKSAEEQGDEFKETAIIVGCVIASVVTVIALIVAIIIVVRRLMQKKDNIIDAPQPEKDRDCSETTCINLDVPCFKPGPSNEQGARDIKSAKRAVNKTPSFRTITGKTKTRMAPVGEESMADHLAIDNENSIPSSPKSPSSARLASQNSIKRLASENIQPNELAQEVTNSNAQFGNTKIRRSRKRDAKNNNVEQKLNENIKEKTQLNKPMKTKEGCKNVSTKPCDTVSPKLVHKTQSGLQTNTSILSTEIKEGATKDEYVNLESGSNC